MKPMTPHPTSRFLVLLLLGAGLLSACTPSVRVPAPVEDRAAVSRLPSPSVVPAQETAKPLPGSENAGQPGFYTVQRGDTLTRIGLEHGQGWRDLAKWNSLGNPDVIEVGQVLRVSPPGGAVETAGVVVRPVVPSSVNPSAPITSSPPTVVTSAKAEPAPVPVSPAANDDGLGFIWPATGAVIAGFDEVKNKGLDISGKAGDPVIAAADGQVVYAGAGLRGYGNLVILKHNSTFLTAYAHNQALLVKEDQKVRKGQKIAEMGKSDADRVKLHFEVRRQGKPVDPAKLLPTR
jgi:lipoprotein NlpD